MRYLAENERKCCYYNPIIQGTVREFGVCLSAILDNGERRWQASVNIDQLIQPAPAGLEKYRPQVS
jgi:hypothetical protein